MSQIIVKAQEAAKAIVALAAPIIVALIADIITDISTITTGGVAAVLSAILVWLTPNKPQESV